jgi:Zinc dependent phospholipase C
MTCLGHLFGGATTISPESRRRIIAFVFVFLFLCLATLECDAYSVMTHEAIIDSAWDVGIKPLLLERFPKTTHDELKTAHAYAYGGSVIQDMGYYPFGSKLFTDLLHYVRTADFVEALLRDSQNVNDYAFALGALAHYVADNNGHRLAVNVSVPVLYPKLRAKYGDRVVYDQNPGAHLKTEFGFDVLQVARGRYAPDDYRDHIGFEVARPLLAKAFEETYGLQLDSIFTNLDLAIGTYRRGVSSVVPKMTKVAWQVKKSDIQGEIPGITRKQFLYHLSRASYEKRWSNDYRQPGFGTKVLAFLFRLIPKVGPFSAFAFRTPTPETERFFMASFNAALTDYEHLLVEQSRTGHAELSNDNLDTGGFTGPGQYPLADKTYAELLDRLAKNHFAQTTPELRSAILDFYKDPSAPFTTKKNQKAWAKVTEEVGELRTFSPNSASPAAAGY